MCDKAHQKIHSSCGIVRIRNLDTQYISYLQSNDTKFQFEKKKKQGDKEILLILCLFNSLKLSAYYWHTWCGRKVMRLIFF